uniref:U89-Liphistoxin-Lth1b_1 n=1 Tax=Liphistius thaleban TaxID=1905330 RepID=A0A4Q8K6G2_9ARAC
MLFLFLFAIGAAQVEGKCSEQDIAKCLSGLATLGPQIQGMQMTQSDMEHACDVLENQGQCPEGCKESSQLGPFLKSINEFKNLLCSKGSDTTKFYSETLPCLAKQDKHVDDCADYVKEKPSDIEENCKNFCKFTSCISKKMEKKCGKEGRRATEVMLGPVTASIEMNCKHPCSGGQTIRNFDWISTAILIILVKLFYH